MAESLDNRPPEAIVQLFVFPDTNVFLHFRFFDEVPWAEILGARQATVVLTQPVLGELDEHKVSGTRREKARAQKVLKRLDLLDLSTAPVPLRTGVDVMALDSEPADALFARHRLSAQVVDDRLVGSVLEFLDANPGCRAVILTDDTGLRVKARGRNLEVARPPEALRNEEEPDETERALEAARRELAAAKSAAPQLDVAFTSGRHLELNIGLAGPLDSATHQGLLAEWRKRHPHISALPDSFPMPGGGQLDMTRFSGLPGFITQDDAREHNTAVDRVFRKYTAYLQQWPSMVNGVRRCIEIQLVLENDGTAPADDVHVELSTDAKGVWRAAPPDVDEPPSMPKPRDMLDIVLSPRVPEIDFSGLRHLDDPIDGPNIPDHGAEAQYWVRRVKHHVPCVLPKVYFQFEADLDVAPLAINYRLVAANIRAPRLGQLNVRITLTAPSPAPNPETAFPERREEDF